MAFRLLAVWIGLTAPVALAGDGVEAPRRLEVGIDQLDVYAEPDDQAFATARLYQGDTVEVRKSLPGGWLAIAPPAGSFHWIDGADVEALSDGRLYVNAPRTTLRLGREGLQRPGPTKVTLAEGAVLHQARQPSLSDNEGRRKKSWRAVAAGADEVRFVRAAGLIDPDHPPRPRPSFEPPERTASHTQGASTDLPPDLAAPVRKIESNHRAVINQPIGRWDFTEVRRDYQSLLASRRDGPARAAVRESLDRVDQADDLSRASREFEALIRKSRQRDAEVDKIKESLRALRASESLSYDAEGLLQATARRVEGEKVFALINDEGQIVAYLRIPPGVDTTNLLARRVGVRGKSRFNEGLRFRLLDVADIEALDDDR
jgi:hypothetical protein